MKAPTETKGNQSPVIASIETRQVDTWVYERCVRILSDIDLSTEITRSVAGKTVTRIRIGTIYPATVGVLPAFLALSTAE